MFTKIKNLPLVIIQLLLISVCHNAYSADVTTLFYNDYSGSITAASDTNGNLLWKEEYEPFGKRVHRSNTSENNIWFKGYYEDEYSGLLYAGSRWYDPNIGRFTSIDPAPVDVFKPNTFNRYMFANNNPYNYSDRNGEIVETALDVVSLGLSIAIYANDPSIFNGFGVVYDAVATSIPFLPAGFGIIRTSAGAVANAAKTLFKTEHYAPRLESVGVSVSKAESAVADAVQAMRNNMEVGADVRGRMIVDNVLIEYRTRLMPDGTVNVGTIFPVDP